MSDLASSFAQAQHPKGCSINERLLELEMVPNARDLGGLPTADGRTIKHGRLMRSGVLAHATDDDLAYLHEVLHLSLVIDLRTPYEVAKTPDRYVPHVRCVNLAVQDRRNNLWIAMSKFTGTEPEKLQAFALTEQGKEMTRKMYVGFFGDEYCQLQFGTFLEMVALQRTDRTILWHCSQGKDRTGLCAALLMFALGCSRETVVREFDLTNEYYRDMIDIAVSQLEAAGGSKDDASVIEAILGVRTDYFEAGLDFIDAAYGSMDNYLRDVLAISDDYIKVLRDNYLE